MYERNGTLVRQKYREFLIPLLLTSFAMSVGSILQNIMIGHFLDENALSAIGLATPPIMLLDMICLVFSVGGVSCATTWLGKLDKNQAKLSFTLAILFSMAITVFFCFYAYSHLGAIANALADGDRVVAALAVKYLKPLLSTGPLCVLSYILIAFISADGHPRYTCGVTLLANVLQLLLSYVFIQHLNLGIRGASLAMMCGYTGGCITALAYFLKRNSNFSFVMPALRDLKLLPSMLTSGFNIGWMLCCRLVSTSILISLLVIFAGAESLSIMVVCTNISMFADIIIDATTNTLLPMSSSLYGEQDYYGIRQLVGTSLKTLLLVSLLLALVFMLLPSYAGVLFGIDSPQVMHKLIPAVQLYASSIPLYAVSSFLQHYYNIIDQKKLSSSLSVLKSMIFLFPAALVFAMAAPDLIWLAFTLAEFLSLLVVILYGQHVKKKKRLQHMLLPADNQQARRLSYTIAAAPEAAQDLVQHIITFGDTLQQDKKLINHVAVAAEEMTIASATYAFKDTKDGLIDFFMYISDDQVIVRFRDNGATFNPIEYIQPEDGPYITDGIELLRKIASRVDYSRQLGFNTTTLTFNRYTQ